jgi:type VI secretion system secreted protein Hcp
MAVDYFLKLDGIPGESADDKHKGEIDVESFSWGATQQGSSAFGGGAGAGKVSYQDFHFVMKMSKASPKLLDAVSTGKHIKQATVTVRKAGTKQQEFLTIKFYDLLVSSYQTGGSGGGSEIPMEQISMNYAKMEMMYKEQKADGSLGSATEAKYDLKANKAY